MGEKGDKKTAIASLVEKLSTIKSSFLSKK
jgi:hypothetical protein